MCEVDRNFCLIDGMRLSRLCAHRHHRSAPRLLSAPSRWLRCLRVSPQDAYDFFRDLLVSLVVEGGVEVRRRLFWPNSLQTFRAFFSPSSSPARSPRCPLPSPSSAGFGRATPASNENTATPRRPSNRPRLRLPQTKRSPAVGATRTLAVKTQRATIQAPRLLQALASSPGHSLRGFGGDLPEDQAKPAQARPSLSNLASDKSPWYVIPFIVLLRS